MSTFNTANVTVLSNLSVGSNATIGGNLYLAADARITGNLYANNVTISGGGGGNFSTPANVNLDMNSRVISNVSAMNVLNTQIGRAHV